VDPGGVDQGPKAPFRAVAQIVWAGCGFAISSDDPEVTTDITEQELLRRKDFLELHDEDVAHLIGINDLAQRYAESVIEDFYRHLLSFDETKVFFSRP
jgi:rsbT co-antagonist protein RsbR